MDLQTLWKKYKDWLVSIIIISFVIILTLWNLYFEPQRIPLFLATAIIAFSFVVMMALLPKYRQRFAKKIIAYHAKEKRLGALYRYKIVATALIIINSVIFSIAWRYQFIPSQYVPFYVLTFLIITLASGIVLIAGLLKTAGKWGLLLIAILTLVAVLNVWIWALSRT